MKLAPILNIKAYLIYHINDLEGAMPFPFLAKPLVEKLEVAQLRLQELLCDKNGELLIWDAYRTPETQHSIFEQYVKQLQFSFPKLPIEEIRIKAKEYVNPPNIIFPHGTGGAIDVTFMINNKLVWMGTTFDEFSEKSSVSWFTNHPPETNKDKIAATNREVLISAMEFAGFVVLDFEWWHFEWGTQLWRNKTGNCLILDKIFASPTVQSPSGTGRFSPFRQPSLETGAAQVFNTSQARSASLAHEEIGHYYARNSQPTLESLSNFLTTQIVSSGHCYLCESGLAACLLAVKALVPVKGKILYDKYIYYEVERSLMLLAQAFQWNLVKIDFKELERNSSIIEQYGPIDLFYCDNPRNLYLDVFNMEKIINVVHKYSSHLIVDASVQPVQDILRFGVDVVVFSLSKYPSIGLTMGGAILTNHPSYFEKVKTVGTTEGHVLSPEAAFTIWGQSLSLRDRMFALSKKTKYIADFLKTHCAIKQVRIPNSKLLNNLIGGQLSFHLHDPKQGYLMEKVIGNNSLRKKASLHLACTFGSCFTTFEHFASNKRCRSLIGREGTNEIEIPNDLIRLGIGCEDYQDIIDELNFTLNVTMGK